LFEFFKVGSKNIIELKNKLIVLKNDIQLLQSKMSKVLDGHELGIDDKNGVLLKTSAFALSTFNNKHSHYFFVTDFNLRNFDQTSSSFTIDKLLDLNNTQLDDLRIFLNNSKAAVFTSFYLEPKRDLSYAIFNLNSGHLFYGDFTYLQIFSKSNPGILAVMENLPGARMKVLIPDSSGSHVEIPEGVDYFSTLNKIDAKKDSVMIQDQLVLQE
jgi:hypothetical protein